MQEEAATMIADLVSGAEQRFREGLRSLTW
jgi:hypothetical protein